MSEPPRLADGHRVSQWLRGRYPECAVLLLGVAIRLTMRWRYDASWGFDAEQHWLYVQWIAEHNTVPPVDSMIEAVHPPLFYATIAWLLHHGVARHDMVFVPIACGVVRLGVIWAGLEMYLGGMRWARLSALTLAAVLPAAVQVDGMVYPEGLSCMLITAAMIWLPGAFTGTPRTRWRSAVAIGVLIGLAMLTKISAVAVITAVGCVVLIELVASRKVDLRARVVRLFPWAVAMALVLTISGWYFARNVHTHGRPFLVSYEVTERVGLPEVERIPYFLRRKRSFLLGWDTTIYAFPYYPTATGDHARFLPVAMASTFVDFYNYSFAGFDPSTDTELRANGRPLTAQVLRASCRAALGGTIILAGSLAAIAGGLRNAIVRAKWDQLALLVIPIFAALFALHFALKYPLDRGGVIKGTYMQFASAPMYAAYGLAVAWAQRKKARWPLLGTLLAALWVVAAYTLYCRARFLMLPLG